MLLLVCEGDSLQILPEDLRHQASEILLGLRNYTPTLHILLRCLLPRVMHHQRHQELSAGRRKSKRLT